MSKKPALGRGFEGLIPTGLSVTGIAAPGEQVKNLPIAEVIINPDQPRKEFDEVALKELSDSIKQHGIIQPLVVTPKDGKYRIVAGERRYRASKIAKLDTIPAIVRDHAELEELEVALVENVQRVDLSPLEQAVSIVRLRDQFSRSTGQIAKQLGKAETTVINIIRLLQLPKEAIEALQKNLISEGHARAILALKTDENLQKELLNTIVAQKLSVRAAEEFVKNKKAEQKSTAYAEVSRKVSAKLSSIKKNTGIVAKIATRKKGGIVQVLYKDSAELDTILSQLEK